MVTRRPIRKLKCDEKEKDKLARRKAGARGPERRDEDSAVIAIGWSLSGSLAEQ